MTSRPRKNLPSATFTCFRATEVAGCLWWKHPTNDFVLGWAPDGQPRGVPERVKPDIAPIAVHWLGLTGDDSYYYGHFAWVNDVYVVTLDPATGTLQPPQKLVSHVGLDTSPEWSPDGRYLLAQGRSPKLRGAGVQGFYRIDAYTGEITPIVSRSLGLPSNNPEVIQGGMEWPVWSSDGKAMFYRRSHKSNRSQSLVVRDLETGRERELYRAALPAALGEYVGASNLAVSPNGQRLAFVWSDFDEEGPTSTALKVITTARGGEPRELLRVQPPEVIFQPAWMPDGGHVVFGRGRRPWPASGSSGQEQRFELWRVSAEGGELQPLGLAMEGLLLYGLSVHPDGRRIAFTAGRDLGSQTWVMENLLPGLKAAK